MLKERYRKRKFIRKKKQEKTVDPIIILFSRLGLKKSDVKK